MARRKPRKRDNPFSEPQESPEWLETVRQVQACQQKGFDPDQIAAVTGIDAMQVQRIVEDDKLALAVARENFSNRLDTVRNIMGLGLDALLETVKQLQDPEKRAVMIPGIREAKTLVEVIKELNTLVRLEEGKSTMNVATESHTFKQTRVILQDLKRIDPVFDYPELPAPGEEEVIE